VSTTHATHAHGFPSFGPATLCGTGKPSTAPPPIEITCPDCIAIGHDGETIAARLASIEEHTRARAWWASTTAVRANMRETARAVLDGAARPVDVERLARLVLALLGGDS
jgi:hypothetical protein